MEVGDIDIIVYGTCTILPHVHASTHLSCMLADLEIMNILFSGLSGRARLPGHHMGVCSINARLYLNLRSNKLDLFLKLPHLFSQCTKCYIRRQSDMIQV